MFLESYFPRPPKDITDSGYVQRAREAFLRDRPGNLAFLLEKRYGWMNEYVEGKESVVELGAGLGLSREFIRNKNLLLTDLTPYPWIDRPVDATALPFADESVDAFLCSHLIHHLDSPLTFLADVRRRLKPGGVLVIQELESSVLMRVLQRVMRNEGWSYRVDVFDAHASCRPRSDDPWVANTAVPSLLFASKAEFEAKVPGFELVRNELCEGLIFPLSGGVLAKVPVPPLPRPVLRLVAAFDRALIALLPGVFALGRRVVLRKR